MEVKELKQTQGRILGVDFGDVRTGIAICDASRFLASGMSVISPGGIEKVALAIAEIAAEQGVCAIVIGLPVNMDGSEGSRAQRCRKLAALIGASIPEHLLGEWEFANRLANMPVLDAVVEALIEKGLLTPPENGVGAEGCWMCVEK